MPFERSFRNKTDRGPLVIGIDLGGTKLEAALVDDRGRVVASSRRPTEPGRGPDPILAEIASLVRHLRVAAETRPVIGVGIGVAGQIDPATGVVWYAPNLRWRDVPLRARLEAALELPVAVLNDVQAATYGEWVYGAGQGEDNVVCLFVGTGIGGGIVIDGRLLRGCSGSAGELGHTTVELDGPQCRCGNRGCLEALAGGWAIALHAREEIAVDPIAGRTIFELAGGEREGVTATTVARAARAGDALARKIMGAAGEALGAGAVSIVNAFNPCVLILGGGIIDGIPELVAPIEDAIRERALPAAARRVRISRSVLAGHAGVIGVAAWARREIGVER